MLCIWEECHRGLQVFEHIHRALSPLESYEYVPSRSGYAPRNVGRGEILASGIPTTEFVWFEEWKSWDGIEKHGGSHAILALILNPNPDLILTLAPTL